MGAHYPVRIEMAASATVFDVLAGSTITWTDISSFVLYAQGVTFNRGRNAESQATSPGSLTFSVRTKPDGTTAVLPLRRPVRVSWQDGSTWKVLWTGSVTERRQGWQNGVRGVTEIVCSDNLAVAERTLFEPLAAQRAIAIGDLGFAIPLDDNDEGGAPRDVSGRVRGPRLRRRPVGEAPANSEPKFGAGFGPGSSAGVSDNSSVGFAGSISGGWCLNAYNAVGNLSGLSGSTTLSVYVWVDDEPNYFNVALSVSTSAGALDIGVFERKGAMQWGFVPDIINMGFSTLTPGAWHHLAVTSNGSNNYALWVNGVKESETFGAAPANPGRSQVRVGASVRQFANNVNSDATHGAYRGRVAMVAGFDKVLDANQIGALAGVVRGNVGESTLARFNRLVRLAGYATTDATMTPPPVGMMGVQAFRGKSVAALLGEVASVEHSPLVPAKNGRFSLSSRVVRYNITGAALTLPAAAVAPSTSIITSEANLINVVNASRTGGASMVVRDASSIAAYGEHPTTVSWPCWTDSEAETYAAELLAKNKDPRPLTESLTIDVVATKASIDESAVINAEINDVVGLTGLPADSPLSDPLFYIEGISDSITPTSWIRTFNTTLVPADTEVWLLGATANDQLGTDTRLGL